MIVIVDFNLGNLRSILHKLRFLETDARISSRPEDIESAGKLILPGVGSYSAGMNNLRERGLVDALNCAVITRRIPILGICLGMQLFTSYGEEGDTKGLGWIRGVTKKFDRELIGSGLRIPHVGWNDISTIKPCPLTHNLPDERRFYFTHSYHLDCEDSDDVAAVTTYGYDFPSVVCKDNIFGTQFHPEKSHSFGIHVLKSFAEIH